MSRREHRIPGLCGSGDTGARRGRLRPTCRAALAHFCAFLGTAAGDQALCCGAQGGVYIAGGIVPRFTGFLRQSLFRARFDGKGPMRGYVSAIPVYVITRENPGMLGAARADLRS